MRSKNEILECLITCEKSHKKALNEYNKLNQIDALSSTGYNLEKTINNLNGQILALKWVLKNLQLENGKK